MSRLRASVQYGDWRGSAAADDISHGDFHDHLRSIGEFGDDEFLVGIEVFIGDNHPGRPPQPPMVSALLAARGDFDTVKAKLRAQRDPIPLRRVRLDLTLDDLLRKFKRIAITFLRNGLDLDDREYEDTAELQAAALANWDEIQHAPVSVPPQDLHRLATDDAVAAVKNWFRENFDDPAQATPYDGAEGGYQFLWGGPYATRDIVESVFLHALSEKAIERIVDELDRVSTEWVPNWRRLEPPDGEEPVPTQDVEALRAELVHHIGSLEIALSQVIDRKTGIGHNHPPEPLDPEPLDAAERAEISKELGALKTAVSPGGDLATAHQAVARLETKWSRFSGWLGKQGELFATEAVKEAGKQFGTWAPRAFIFWITGLLGTVLAFAKQLIHLLH